MTALPKVERGTFLIVRTDGTEELVQERPRTDAIRRAIGAATLDTVILTWAGRLRADLVMCVNDDGYETRAIDDRKGHIEVVPVYAKLPANPRATQWYHAVSVPGTTHQIVGDVVIVRDADFARVGR